MRPSGHSADAWAIALNSSPRRGRTSLVLSQICPLVRATAQFRPTSHLLALGVRARHFATNRHRRCPLAHPARAALPPPPSRDDLLYVRMSGDGDDTRGSGGGCGWGGPTATRVFVGQRGLLAKPR